MLGKRVSIIILSLLVVGALALAFNVQLVKSDYVWTETIYILADGSISPSTAPIRCVGDYYSLTGNITGENGITDGLIIEKNNMTLDGAGYTIQITPGAVDGASAMISDILLLGVSNATIKNTEIASCTCGINLTSSSNDSISSNDIIDCGYIVYLGSSDNNTIYDNSIISSGGFALLENSSYNTIYGNNMTTETGLCLYDSSDSNTIYRNNFVGSGLDIYYSYENAVMNNTINGLPLVYLEGTSDSTVESDAGQVILVNCNNITVENLDLSPKVFSDIGLELEGTNNSKITNNTVANLGESIRTFASSNNAVYGNNITNNLGCGIFLGDVEVFPSENNTVYGNNITGIGRGTGVYLAAPNNIVYGNNITNNRIGIQLGEAHNNTIYGNNITNSTSIRSGGGYGVYFGDPFSSDNEFYHNNFIGNDARVGGYASVNVWDAGYPSGGNYWSDYNGTDTYSGPSQNILGSDGIGDTPYIIDANNTDNYPLMQPWVPYTNGTIYINADGSVDPSGAPILRKGDLYTLTDNITSSSDGIVIERDNIVVNGAGYTVTGSGNGNGMTLTNMNNVTLDNLTIENFIDGIYLDSSSGTTLSGNTVIANNGDGIELDSSSNNTLSSNNVTNNTYGIGLVFSSENAISNDSITGNDFGIDLSFSNNDIVSGDNVANNTYGIYLDSSESNSIFENNVAGNSEDGIWLYYSQNNFVSGNNATANFNIGIWLDYNSDYDTVSENDAMANNWTGIVLSSSSNYNIISGNNASSNASYGTCLLSSSNNTILENNITANSAFGISLWSSSDNVIFHNNFVNNTQQAYSDAVSMNAWDSSYPIGGNYWSDYNGADIRRGPYQNETGSDMIGDTLYAIFGTSDVDNYPLMTPWSWGWTSMGENITVTDVTGVSLTFSNVTSTGITTLNETKTAPVRPSGFILVVSAPTYYDIETTANYTGNITACLPYDDAGMTLDQENSLQLMHWDETLQQWVNITTRLDTTNNLIYGETSSLSPFAIMQQTIPGDIDGDGTVFLSDLSAMAAAWGSTPTSPNWNPNADIVGEGQVFLGSLAVMAAHWTESWTPP